MSQFMPSMFANRFYVSACGKITRISFGELLDGREEMHTGLTLLTEDAVALRDLLNQLFPSI